MELNNVSYPRLLERFCEPLMIHPTKLEVVADAILPALLSGVKSADWATQKSVNGLGEEEDKSDSIVVVKVEGSLVSSGGLGFSGFVGYDALGARLDRLVAEGITKIVLWMDSAGGEVPQCFELAKKIAGYKDQGVRVMAYVSGMATSAAYALISGTERIFAAPVSTVGSIGVIGVRLDKTAYLQKEGLAYEVYRAGSMKALGASFEAPSQAVKDKFQGRVEYLYEIFLETMQELRGLSVKDLRSQQSDSFDAKKGLELGLVDEIAESFDVVVQAFSSEVLGRNLPVQVKKGVKMDEQEVVVAAAVAAERQRTLGLLSLKATFSAVDDDMLVQCVEDGTDLAMAGKLFAAVQKASAAATAVKVSPAEKVEGLKAADMPFADVMGML